MIINLNMDDDNLPEWYKILKRLAEEAERQIEEQKKEKETIREIFFDVRLRKGTGKLKLGNKKIYKGDIEPYPIEYIIDKG